MLKKHAVGAVLLWSTVASAFKLSLRYMSPLASLLGLSDVARSLRCSLLPELQALQRKPPFGLPWPRTLPILHRPLLCLRSSFRLGGAGAQLHLA